MKIGFIGLGKLGLPIALAIDAAGHEVTGYDVSDAPGEQLHGDRQPFHHEEGMDELLQNHSITMASRLENAVLDKAIVFVCVQTPHAPELDGSMPAPAESRDFEYAFLAQALKDIGRVPRSDSVPIVAVISTVLPGTLERLQHHLPNYPLIYNPSFCAMGTVIPDYQNPEFILLGTEDTARARDMWLSGKLADFYGHQTNVCLMSIPSAELTKVAYNTFIGMKIVFANTMMEICHHTGADVDDVTNALGQATDRLISPRYMSGGMGDGGPCHPRDNIAMSWLAERLDLSYDFFDNLIRAREDQSLWLAGLVAGWSKLMEMPVTVLGRAYKPGSVLVDGSPADLLYQHLLGSGVDPLDIDQWDPIVDGEVTDSFDSEAVYVIATKHAQFAEQEFPAGSVVLDPFGYIPDQEGVTVVRIGRKS